MAYGRRRSSRSYSTRGRAGCYSRRRTTRRRSSGGRSQRIVIQVIGGPTGGVPIAATSGTKGVRTLRARY